MHRGEMTFTIHRVEIPVKTLNEPIYLIPFGDIHRWAPLCDVDRWLEFLAWAAKKPNAYFLGMGDYDDLASYSERRAIQAAHFHESTMDSIESLMKQRTLDLIDEMKFMRGKLLGLIEGNHFGELPNGISTTQLMCEKLNCKYLGVSSFVRLSFVHGSKRAVLDIWAHHGRGSSRLLGTAINNVAQLGNCGVADIYLMGHDHKKIAGTSNRLILTDGGGDIKLSNKKVLYARTGSFLKGYVPGEASYVARAALPPTDLGVSKIELTPKRTHKTTIPGTLDKSTGKRIRYVEDSFYVDIHCSI